MLKIFLLVLLFFSTVIAKSYNFNEIRYSDAINKSITLQGNISFYKDGLLIKYNSPSASLYYQNKKLVYKRDNKKVKLSKQNAKNIMRYFQLLILIHNGDKNVIEQLFTIKHKADKTILMPNVGIRHYVSKIVLKKQYKQLKQIKLFLENKDSITISIKNEIR